MKVRHVLLITYLWSEGVGFSAIKRLSGASNTGVTNLLGDMQQAVVDECLKNPPMIRGPNKVVEIDETEVGVRRKGIKRSPSNVRMDVWGCVERDSGLLVFHHFDKVNKYGHIKSSWEEVRRERERGERERERGGRS